MNGLRSVEDQLQTVLDRVRAVKAVGIGVAQAQGLTLREPVHTAVDIPVFDNSAMDGFAVRFDDVATATPDEPARLRVVADMPAGSADDPGFAPGEAVRIMTGSPIPSAADTIVPFEDTVGGLADSLGTIAVTAAPVRRGMHVRSRGEDAAAGEELLPAGVAVSALSRASIAAAGVATVTVSRRPRVAVISTGSELVPPGTPLRRGQIPESNSELLAGLVTDASAEVVLRRSVPDDGDGPVRAIADAREREADAVVFSGGVSAGAYEVVKQTLADAMTFTRVAMQPGKPQGFGALEDGTLLFGLPGNPVSAAVSFEVFVRPALLAMQRRAVLHRPLIRLSAARDWRTPPGRRQYLPVVIDRSDPGGWLAVPATTGGSHLAGGLGQAEGYAVVPAEVDAVAAGDTVDVMLIA